MPRPNAVAYGHHDGLDAQDGCSRVAATQKSKTSTSPTERFYIRASGIAALAGDALACGPRQACIVGRPRTSDVHRALIAGRGERGAHFLGEAAMAMRPFLAISDEVEDSRARITDRR